MGKNNKIYSPSENYSVDEFRCICGWKITIIDDTRRTEILKPNTVKPMK